MSGDPLTDQLIAHEGLRLKPYVDTVGKVTLGVGRNLTDKGITATEALYLLGNDLDEVVADLATFPWWLKLDAVRQRAMIDCRFNLGHDGFRGFKRMVAAMARKDYPLAAKHLLDSKAAREDAPARYQALAAMLITGEV